MYLDRESDGSAAEGAAAGRRFVFLNSASIAGKLTIRGRYSGISLVGASVGDNLALLGAQIGPTVGGDDYALNAERCQIDGDLYLRPDDATDPEEARTLISGGVNLTGARIRGAVLMDGILLDAPTLDSRVLVGEGLEVQGQLEIRPGSLAQDHREADGAEDQSLPSELAGGIDLTDGRFGGSIIVRGTTIVTDDGFSIELGRAHVGGDVLFGEQLGEGDRTELPDVTLRGGLSLASASVGGSVIVGNCGIAAHGDEASTRDDRDALWSSHASAFSAQLLRANAGIMWTPAWSQGGVDLSFAHTQIYQDAPARWPIPGLLNLEGMTYQKLAGDPMDITPTVRIAWLRRQWEFAPDSYNTLRDAYLRHGDRAGAADVAIAKSLDAASARGPMWHVLAQVYRVVAGCGYKPIRSIAGWWCCGLPRRSSSASSPQRWSSRPIWTRRPR